MAMAKVRVRARARAKAGLLSVALELSVVVAVAVCFSKDTSRLPGLPKRLMLRLREDRSPSNKFLFPLFRRP